MPHVLRDGVIEPWTGRAGGPAPPPWAVVMDGNPLVQLPAMPAGPAGARVALRSGWLGDEDPAEGGAPDARMWTSAAWGALDAMCDRLRAAAAERGLIPCLWPRAGHVLSDPQGCLTFLRRREASGRSDMELLLEPCAMLTASMLANAEDHLSRAFEALGGHPSVTAVMLSNLRAPERGDGPLLPAPLHRGAIDAAVIARLAAAHVPVTVPTVFAGDEIEGQIAAARAFAPRAGAR